jgi:drug/metabolite transporter (DMT)-like permease
MFNIQQLNNRGTRFVILSLTLGAMMISFSGVWVKMSHVTPTTSAFYRLFLGSIFLLIGALFRREFHFLKTKQLLPGLICGLFLGLDLNFYHYSVEYVGPGLGTMLPNFQVFILAAVGILFFKEKPGLMFFFSVPLAFVGLFLIIGIDWAHLEKIYKIGVYYGLGAAACYAVSLLFLRKMQADQVGAAIFLVIFIVSASSAFFLGLENYRLGNSFRIPDLQSLLALLALGLFSQSMGWILIINALPHIRASLSGLVLLLQPALAFVWDVLFFQRPTNLLNWIGVCAVLLAIYFGTMRLSLSRR